MRGPTRHLWHSKFRNIIIKIVDSCCSSFCANVDSFQNYKSIKSRKSACYNKEVNR